MKREICLMLVLFLVVPAMAQTPDSKLLERRLDSLISLTQSSGDPGMVVGVVTGNVTRLKKAYGSMNLDYRIPVTDSTVFNLASVSKQFTAYAIQLLAEQGKINLDEDIHAYLPDLPDYKNKITVRHLVHHTSGIASTDNLKLFSGISLEAPWSRNEEYELLKRYNKLNFKPNEEHLYSNAGYFLLAEIIAKASGQSFSDFMTREVFVPLGMMNTFIYDYPGKVIPNRAAGYQKEGTGYFKANTEADAIYGSTNIYTSLNDMLKWVKHFTTSETDDSFNLEAFNPKDKLNNGDTIKYTYGLNVGKYKGVKMVDHGGYTKGFKTFVMLFPDQRTGIFVLSNNESTDTWNIASKLADWCLSEKLVPDQPKERKEITVKSEILHRYEGIYQMPDGMRLTYKMENDTLKLEIPGAPVFPLFATTETDFFLKAFDAQCTFEKNQDGAWNQLVWHQSGQNLKAVKVMTKKEITNGELVNFTGKYYNQALDIEYPVNLDGQTLIMTVPRIFKTYVGIEPQVKLSHLDGDRFFTQQLGLVEFLRDAKNQISGFRFVDVGRIRDITFLKKM